MTKKELDELVDRTEEAIHKTEKLKEKAHQEIHDREQAVHRLEGKIKSLGTSSSTESPDGKYDNTEVSHLRSEQEVVVRDIKALEGTIQRLNDERVTLVHGRNELQRLERSMEDIMHSADAWRNTLSGMLATVDSEHI